MSLLLFAIKLYFDDKAFRYLTNSLISAFAGIALGIAGFITFALGVDLLTVALLFMFGWMGLAYSMGSYGDYLEEEDEL